MGKHKDKFELTPLQERFVEYFCGEAEFDAVVSMKRAGYKTSSRPISAAQNILKSDAVKRAIHNRMHESTFWLNEGVVIDRLFKEGMTANSASARVNALVWVGKHLGMWQEKTQEDSQITYNIVNYGTSEEDMVKSIEAKPEVETNLEKAVLPEGIALVSYSSPDKAH